jgi:hypothetical protein
MIGATSDSPHCPPLSAANLVSPKSVARPSHPQAAVLAQGHEGVMAKHQAATYRPGRRSPAWRKIKPPRTPRAQPLAQAR